MKKSILSNKCVLLGCLTTLACAYLNASEVAPKTGDEEEVKKVANDTTVTTISAPGGVEIKTETPTIHKEGVGKDKKDKKAKGPKVKKEKQKKAKPAKEGKAEKESESKTKVSQDEIDAKMKAHQEIVAKFIGALAVAQSKLKGGAPANECLDATLTALQVFFNEKAALFKSRDKDKPEEAPLK